jgi:hypothetical protein
MPAKREYEEDDRVLKEKAVLTANLIKDAKHFVVHVRVSSYVLTFE